MVALVGLYLLQHPRGSSTWSLGDVVSGSLGNGEAELPRDGDLQVGRKGPW